MRSFCQPCQRPLRNGWEQQQRQQGPQLLQQYPAPCRRQRSIQCSSTQHQDLYVVLGVSYDADASDIKAAFRTKAKQLHPDVNKAADAETAFRLLKRAHEVLSDGMLRAAHDSELREQLPEASAALRARDPRFARWAQQRLAAISVHVHRTDSAVAHPEPWKLCTFTKSMQPCCTMRPLLQVYSTDSLPARCLAVLGWLHELSADRLPLRDRTPPP